jgi:hypothetical protein
MRGDKPDEQDIEEFGGEQSPNQVLKKRSPTAMRNWRRKNDLRNRNDCRKA